ncbi:helix-turn-helix transcriptional regulator [Cysteiniphilum halobium]|uniref:helix-turn-helix transcriptional regulator n=1 Tax=Cysteiniphilum halobium TaxID=2219059 RepID=UPI000E6588BB|nr:LuxR C-terminal-related transcriptional regulator [Cysteiniphilum halobium]
MNQANVTLPSNMSEFLKYSKNCYDIMNKKYHNWIDKFGFNKFWRIYVEETGMFSMISDTDESDYVRYITHDIHKLSEIIKHPSYIYPGIYLDSTIYINKPESLKLIREIGNFNHMVYCIIKFTNSSYISYVFNSPIEIIISEQFGQKIMRLARQIEFENAELLHKDKGALIDLKAIGLSKWFSHGMTDSLFHLDLTHISQFLLKIGLVQNGLDTLTDKEQMCLALLGQDCDIAQTAEKMKTSKRTIYYYCDSIKTKLGLYSLQSLYKIAHLSVPFLHETFAYSTTRENLTNI